MTPECSLVQWEAFIYHVKFLPSTGLSESGNGSCIEFIYGGAQEINFRVLHYSKNSGPKFTKIFSWAFQDFFLPKVATSLVTNDVLKGK